MNSKHYNSKVLLAARKAKFTQSELAETLGVSELTVLRAEKGRNASYDLLDAMCKELGIDLKSILISESSNFFARQPNISC